VENKRKNFIMCYRREATQEIIEETENTWNKAANRQ